MNRGYDRLFGLFAIHCTTLVAAASMLLPLSRAQDTVPCPPPNHRVHAGLIAEHPISGGGVDTEETRLIHCVTEALSAEFGEGLRFRIVKPYFGREFQITVIRPSTCCEELLERIGVDFEVCDKQAGNLLTNFFSLGRAASGEQSLCANEAVCGVECVLAESKACTCGACKCDACKCAECRQGACKCSALAANQREADCGDETCAVTRMIIRHANHHDEERAEVLEHNVVEHLMLEHHPLKLMQHIASLMAEKAAAEAALEAKEEADEKLGELVETVTELIATNASLEAKLEAQAEHAKLAQKIADLAHENGRLKAHLELADQRSEATKHAMTLMLENERLKYRLADLEQKHAAAEAARTAEKRRDERSSR
jgi:hypothetical protein